METSPNQASPLKVDSEQRTAGIARLAFQLAGNGLLDDALAGNRTVESAGEAIKMLRPEILGVGG